MKLIIQEIKSIIISNVQIKKGLFNQINYIFTFNVVYKDYKKIFDIIKVKKNSKTYKELISLIKIKRIDIINDDNRIICPACEMENDKTYFFCRRCNYKLSKPTK